MNFINKLPQKQASAINEQTQKKASEHVYQLVEGVQDIDLFLIPVRFPFCNSINVIVFQATPNGFLHVEIHTFVSLRP